MTTLSLGLVVVHSVVSALWLGSMAYSLFVLQPKLPRIVDAAAPPVGEQARPVEEARQAQRVEEPQRVLAHGNRWRVAALIGVLWATGLGLVLQAPERTAGWWAAVAGKGVLLAGATGLFWWISWRGWPRRVFALPAELPALQRRFRRVALTMCGLVGAAYLLGLLTAH
ncbi:hypothetical protein [Plantactinospora sp. B5E13]|uniref:hypothetical protein n=1 Tax=Plantactinospora sp. B5E13 TaxID=3153758 RepID=UPI00325F322C